jgi:outer membrane lipoprotein carrier protein
MNFKHLGFSAFFGAACLISSTVFADEGVKQFKQFVSTVNNAEGEFSQQQIRATKQGESQSKVLRKSQGRVFKDRASLFGRPSNLLSKK